MMRRRGGTNKLKGPKKDKKQVQAQARKNKKPKVVAEISGDVHAEEDPLEDGAGESSNVASEESDPISIEIPGPSTLASPADPFGDFVFKRPKTPPPRTCTKKLQWPPSVPAPVESRRIRSKLKPGKTGFPIGASLHGLSRSEKMERRSREKYHRSQPSEVDQQIQYSRPAILDQLARRLSLQKAPVGSNEHGIGRQSYSPNESWGSGSPEKMMSFPQQTVVTKLKFPTPRQRSVSDKRSKRNEDSGSHQNAKESLEICQGFSKIKIEDWYPLFDFYHSKRNAPETETSAGTGNVAEEVAGSEDDDDDEWEESLVYLDLEDIPDVAGLFSSLAGRRRPSAEGEPESEDTGPLSRIEMKIFNLDSELPVLLLGGRYLAGRWEDSCGTSLFFKKKQEDEEENNGKPPLKNIVPEPEIPYDSVFGKNYTTDENGYELVAKSVKVLKARHFPVVNEELKGEDIVRDADDEFDHKDFQIPPVNMVREFMPAEMTYEELMEKDTERRKQIREKWENKLDKSDEEATNIVKTEPVDHDEESVSDTEDLDNIIILGSEDAEICEPTPGPSRCANK